MTVPLMVEMCMLTQDPSQQSYIQQHLALLRIQHVTQNYAFSGSLALFQKDVPMPNLGCDRELGRDIMPQI